ncbi:leucine rich adaptor protein 1 isoform X2 [Fukomys damarensis]|uniref:leucine rich adaptor protein 1 isoform X2 n=1 Tax=Fukomys damarensis TaxID=885580 RepID=UPI00054001FF|nr:leucine rich adaptor protein 1 isoform X2 [Fukomys damarensis]
MEGTVESQTPDLRDVEGKVGRKTPEGLLRGLRGDWELELSGVLLPPGAPGTSHGLGDKIVALRMELASLRAIDVKILQQLVTLNEGIEAVRWLLEERGTLTSHCSSLTSSQYSLTGGSPGCSRRGSWDSLPDTNSTDRLDSVSIGSFLDTVAPREPDEQGPPGAPCPEMDWAKVIPGRETVRGLHLRLSSLLAHSATDLCFPLFRACPVSVF